MRVLLILLVAVIIGSPALAADTPHEEAARKFVAAWMNVDRPRLVHGFVAVMGASNPDTKALVLEALDSPELEAIYVKHIVKTFSVDELTNLNAMAVSPAFKLFNERMPSFTAQVLPEVVNFFRSSTAELSRRVAEKRKRSGGN
jgi:hypothetical protein